MSEETPSPKPAQGLEVQSEEGSLAGEENRKKCG